MTEKASTDQWRSRFMSTTFLCKGEESIKRGSLIQQAITLAGPKDIGLWWRWPDHLRTTWFQLGQPTVGVLRHLLTQTPVIIRRGCVRRLRANRDVGRILRWY